MDLAITIDPESKLPLYRQLYEEVRRLVLTGRLLPGQRLPSTRRLARSLRLGRITVIESYEQLISEGYLQAKRGSGTFVSQQLPEDLLRPSSVQFALSADKGVLPFLQLSSYGASLTDSEPFEPPISASLISFRFGQPETEKLPLGQWRKLWSRHCRLGHHAVFNFTYDSLGYKPLREAIVRYVVRTRALQCEADQVIIVNGTLQAINLLTHILIERGDRVVIEEPSFLDVRRIFQSHGAQLLPIPVDESGIMVEKLPACSSPKIKLVHTTPSHQFPTGAVLSLPRRLELLAWASASGVLIIEEDYDSDYRYAGRPIPALQGLDRSGSVIYIGNFSEALFPALPIGYMVVPIALVHVLSRAKWLADRQSPLLEQHVLTDFINEGHLERHIRCMRVLYEQRRQTLVHSLLQNLGEQVTILGDKAGIHLVVRLHSHLSDEEIINRAAQAGVGLCNTRPYYLTAAYPGEFLLGYAHLDEQKIAVGVRQLSEVLMNR